MPTWPNSLPCHPIQGTWSETPQRNVVAFQPEVGPPKFRRRSTANGTRASGTFKMSKAELATFLSFYGDDLQDGSLPFEWDHPITDDRYSWAFESEPEVTSVTRAAHQVSIQLRRLP